MKRVAVTTQVPQEPSFRGRASRQQYPMERSLAVGNPAPHPSAAAPLSPPLAGPPDAPHHRLACPRLAARSSRRCGPAAPTPARRSSTPRPPTQNASSGRSRSGAASGGTPLWSGARLVLSGRCDGRSGPCPPQAGVSAQRAVLSAPLRARFSTPQVQGLGGRGVGGAAGDHPWGAVLASDGAPAVPAPAGRQLRRRHHLPVRPPSTRRVLFSTCLSATHQPPPQPAQLPSWPCSGPFIRPVQPSCMLAALGRTRIKCMLLRSPACDGPQVRAWSAGVCAPSAIGWRRLHLPGAADPEQAAPSPKLPCGPRDGEAQDGGLAQEPVRSGCAAAPGALRPHRPAVMPAPASGQLPFRRPAPQGTGCRRLLAMLAGAPSGALYRAGCAGLADGVR